MMIGTCQILVFLDIILKHKINHILVSFERNYSHIQKIESYYGENMSREKIIAVH